MKRIIIIALLAVFFPAWAGTALAQGFAGGDGSEWSPYQIENWHHLNNVRNNTCASHGDSLWFVLNNDLDADTEGYAEHAGPDANEGKGWDPVPFHCRFFEGGGRTISDLYINRPDQDFVGLFSKVCEYHYEYEQGPPVVRDVILENVDITGQDYVGSLAGATYFDENLKGWPGLLYGGNVQSGIVKGRDYVGGLVGSNQGFVGVYLIDSAAHVDVTGRDYVGGLVGDNSQLASDPEWMIENDLAHRLPRNYIFRSYATGDVTGRDYVGGLTGSNNSGDGKVYGIISNNLLETYATGNVTGANYVGGLVGMSGMKTGRRYPYSRYGTLDDDDYGHPSEIIGSYATGDVASSGDIVDSEGNVIHDGGWHVGGLVGYMAQTRVEEVWNTSTLSYATGNVSGKESVGGLVGLMHNNSHIQNAYATGNVTSTGSDITFYNRSFGVGGLVGSIDLGGSTTNSISYCHAEGDVTHEGGPDTFRTCVGGLVGIATASVINQSYATGDVTDHGSGYLTGGLVGGGGHISNSYAIGNVVSQAISTEDYITGVGGLVGFASNISNSFATGSVTGADRRVGGLVGLGAGDISESFATGNVEGNNQVGGLVGRQLEHKTTTDSYATGNVTGNNEVGGLVGNNSHNLVNSYATGAVAGNSDVGGLVGTDTGTVINSFWDTETSGMETSAGGEGRTTAEMKQQDTFESWDFEEVWAIKEYATYPYHLWDLPPEIEITVELSVDPPEGGEVSGGDVYEHGDGVLVTAQESPGYFFVNWTENSEEVSKEATYAFTAKFDRSLTAHFSAEVVEPNVTTEAATAVDTDSATLNLTCTVGDYSAVDVRFNWREVDATDWETTGWVSREEDGSHAETLTALVSNTTYEFKARLQYDDPAQEIEGEVETFTTDAAEPNVTTEAATDETTVSALLQGELDIGDETSVEVLFRYRIQNEESWIETESQVMEASGAFNEEITGLENDTTYEFKTVVQWDGEEIVGDVETFSTLTVESTHEDDAGGCGCSALAGSPAKTLPWALLLLAFFFALAPRPDRRVDFIDRSRKGSI